MQWGISEKGENKKKLWSVVLSRDSLSKSPASLNFMIDFIVQLKKQQDLFLWEYLGSKVGEVLPISSSIETTSLTVHLHPWRQFKNQFWFHGTIKSHGQT